MTKDNILFSIIGVLLGLIAGYVFATTVNQRGYTPKVSSGAAGGQVAQDSILHGNKQPAPNETAAAAGSVASSDAAAIERAQAQPENFEAQMEAARALYQDRRFDEAAAALERANQLRPDSYETIVALGNTNFDAGRYEIAEKWYTAALVKKPDDINVRTDLGLTFLFREPMDVDRAIKEFRRSLELDPNHVQTLQNLAVALTKKGSLDEAEATLKRLAEVDPTNQGLTKLRAELDAARSSGKAPVAGK